LRSQLEIQFILMAGWAPIAGFHKVESGVQPPTRSVVSLIISMMQSKGLAPLCPQPICQGATAAL
jgi:hypothetical protein